MLYQVFQIAVEDDVIRANPTVGMMKELWLTHKGGEKRKSLTIEQELRECRNIRCKDADKEIRGIFDNYVSANRNSCILHSGIKWMKECV